MNGLLSSASPWHNDCVTNNSTSKKRIPSLSLPRNKTIKNNYKTNNKSDPDLEEQYNLENEDTTIFQVNSKETFQNIPSSTLSMTSPQNTLENIQQDNQNRMTRVQQLINSINVENDGQSLANFKPLDYSSSSSSTSSSETSNYSSDKYIPIKPLYSMNEQQQNNIITSNPYSSYRDVYSGDIGYTNTTNPNINRKENITPPNEKLMEKINRMLHILEEQQYEPTKHITEEFILYTFLGVFVIYIVDSFSRAGKYIR